MKNIVAVTAILALVFTSLPSLTGEIFVHAVSTPARVKTFNATTYSNTSIRLTWKKPGKCAGYAVYQNGKFLRRIPRTWTAYNVPKLKAATTYKYTIRTYNTYKRKQWYNSKTKKWQNSKPKKSQWKGKKTRKVTAYKYGKVSTAKTATTGPAKVTGLKCTGTSASTANIQWTKQTKALTGYAIYKDGSWYKTVGKDTTTASITGLTTNKTYNIKVRSYIKVGSKTVFGAYSSAITVKPVAADSKFAASTLENRTVNIADGNQYINFSVNTSDSVKWSVSGDACAIYGSKTNATVTVYCYLEGTAKLTCTNSDGNSKSCTIKVIKGSSSSGDNNNSGGDAGPKGIDTPYGTIFPSDDGTITMTMGEEGVYSYGLNLNGVECPPSTVYNYLPSSTVIKVNATDVSLIEGGSQTGHFSNVMESSNPSVAYLLKSKTSTTVSGLSGIDTLGGGIVFVRSGDSTITFKNGTSIKFVVAGKNNEFSDYLDYIASIKNNVAGSSEYDKVAYFRNHILDNYSYKNYQSSFEVWKYGKGDCWGANNLLIRLCREVGITAELRDAGKESSSSSHRNTHVVIEGVDYIVDATPETGTVFETWASYRDRKGLTDADL